MTNTPPRPTSSRTSSRRGDDLPKVTSSLVPHPSGDEVTLRPSEPPTENNPSPRPRDEVNTGHHPTHYWAHKLGAWATCSCSWKSATFTTLSGAELAFGQHLLAATR